MEELAAINENGRFNKPDPRLDEEKARKAWEKYDNDLFQTGRLYAILQSSSLQACKSDASQGNMRSVHQHHAIRLSAHHCQPEPQQQHMVSGKQR